MQLQMGRPADLTGRLEKEIRVYDLLDRLQIPYGRVDHEPAMTMEICAGIDGALGTRICKNLLLCNRQQTDFYLLMMPADKNFRTSVLSKEIGTSRLSFASGEHMEALLDITPGSLSVLGLMNDQDRKVKLLVDGDLLEEPSFGCHPCINTSSLKLAVSDLLEKILPCLQVQPRVVHLPWSAE